MQRDLPSARAKGNGDLVPTWRARYASQVTALLASVVVGFVSYLIQADLQQSIWLGLTTALGLLVVETTSVVVALTRAVNATNARLDNLFTTLGRRDEFFKVADRLHDSGPTGQELASTVQKIHTALNDLPPSAFALVNGVLTRPAIALAGRHLVVSADESPSSLALHLVGSFQRSVFATSLHPLHFWLTTYGQNYQAKILERMRLLGAVNGDVTFRRVFIVKREIAGELTTAPYRGIIQAQIDAGIDVRACYESDIIPSLCEDFGIWDDQLVVRHECDSNRRIIRRHYLYSHDAIIDAKRQAEAIWDCSVPFNTWLSASRTTMSNM